MASEILKGKGSPLPEENASSPVELATELTVAWLTNHNNRINADEVPEFLRTMHRTITELSSGSRQAEPEREESVATAEFTPAVSVRKSLASKDHIISMIDGKPYRTLRRHLSTHGLTPEEYRERYNLRADYPMVAPSYSEARRAMAHKIGLGAKGRKSKSSAPAAAKPGVRKARNAETSEG
ncbi:MucR family transcriptional regulator [Sphingomonas sp. R1]|uniref:MucR family transcriptional regulator n=1 Tax=Sphingomonas sp. R1 TaxID=399176 RepID=UPI0039B59CC0